MRGRLLTRSKVLAHYVGFFALGLAVFVMAAIFSMVMHATQYPAVVILAFILFPLLGFVTAFATVRAKRAFRLKVR